MKNPTVIVVFNERGRILAQRKPRSTRLPVISIEKGRTGFAISRAVQDQLGLQAFLLLPPNSRHSSLPLLRLQVEGAAVPPEYSWLEPHEITSGSMPEPDVFASLSPDDTSVGQYSWYPQVVDWLQRRTADLGLKLRLLEPWNSRSGNALLRVTTDGPQFWFKALHASNWRDFSISQLLAEEYPQHSPRIVATDLTWNALLLEHREGIGLDQCHDMEACKAAARMYAEVQVKWTARVERFLRAGASDFRASALAERIVGFLDHVERTMTSSRENFAWDLGDLGFKGLSQRLEGLCSAVNDLPCSEGLVTIDPSPHSVIITPVGLVILDWAHACVSLPLIAGEYLWHQMAAESLEHARWSTLLHVNYLYEWEDRSWTYDFRTSARATCLLPAFSTFAAAMFHYEHKSDASGDYDRRLCSFVRGLVMLTTEGFLGYPGSGVKHL